MWSARATSWSSGSTACSASACARSPAASGPRWSGWRRRGASRSTPPRCSRAHPAPAVIALVHAETSTGVRNDVEPVGARQRATPCCSSTPSPRSAASRSRSTAGASTSPTAGPRNASASRPAWRRSPCASGPGRALERPASSWYFDLGLIARYVEGSGRPHVPPHGAGLHDLRPPRRARRRCSRRASRRRGPGTRRAAAPCRTAWRSSASSSSPPAEHRLPQLTTVRVPDDLGGMGEADVRRRPARPIRHRDRRRRRGRWPGRSGGSAAWGTRRGCATSSCSWSRWGRCWDDDRPDDACHTARAQRRADPAADPERGRLRRVVRGPGPLPPVARALGAPAGGSTATPEDRASFAARCAARERERQMGSGYGFGIFVDGPVRGRDHAVVDPAGAVPERLRRVLGRRGHGGPGLSRPRPRWRSCASPSRSSGCTGWRSPSCPATAPAGGWSRSCGCARRAWRCAISRSTGTGRTTSATP